MSPKKVRGKLLLISTNEFEYPAFLSVQNDGAKDLILFDAPATEIALWAGIPQRGRMNGEETVGFQRQEDPKRVEAISAFFNESRNIIQNPLLCAAQGLSEVAFIPSSEDGRYGKIRISYQDLATLDLLELLKRLQTKLEDRLPHLAEESLDPERFAAALEQFNITSEVDHIDSEAVSAPEEPDIDEETAGDADSEEELNTLLSSDESLIFEFYKEVRLRVELLGKLESPVGVDDCLGFTKNAVISYLLPAVVVDGQHRLQGAVTAARQLTTTAQAQTAMADAIAEGADPQTVEFEAMTKLARRLPVSMLMDDSPSEHVFQFVVVNQKATPISKPLLGTIVSTSLSHSELEQVADRLVNAGISLEHSKAVAFLSRDDSSPFKGLVDSGLPGTDRSALLQWSVLEKIVEMFRLLKGGKLYHESNPDYAALWKKKWLAKSELVTSGAYEQKETAFDTWSQTEGPWRDVLIRFFALVRDHFGSDDPLSRNYWGRPSHSNLFNKIYLTILAADFFQFIESKESSLNSLDEVNELFEKWVGTAKPGYFARDWGLTVKKDLPAIRSKWSQTWVEYRKDPAGLPSLAKFRL